MPRGPQVTVLRSAMGIAIYHLGEMDDKLEKIYIATVQDMQQRAGKRFIVAKDPIFKDKMLILFDRMIKGQATMEEVLNSPSATFQKIDSAISGDPDPEGYYRLPALIRANLRRKRRRV
jgi:hypothetical protein